MGMRQTELQLVLDWNAGYLLNKNIPKYLTYLVGEAQPRQRSSIQHQLSGQTCDDMRKKHLLDRVSRFLAQEAYKTQVFLGALNW